MDFNLFEDIKCFRRNEVDEILSGVWFLVPRKNNSRLVLVKSRHGDLDMKMLDRFLAIP